MSKPMTIKDGISIIMPTYRRPQDLPRALGSLEAQTDISLPIEIIVTDNDPAGSAKDAVAKFSKSSQYDVIYVHEPNPGVSNARNAAIAQASGRYIAWLDDDQEAAPNWISELLKCLTHNDAGLAFCPSPPVMEVSTHLDVQYENFFARKAPAQDGVIDDFYGCGNSMMDLFKFTLPNPVFDPIANESGGEDDMLFNYIQKQGVATAWTSTTYCYEHVPAKRATPDYVRKRSFAWGQGPSEIAKDEGNILGLLRWMIIGAGQICVYGPIMLFADFTKRDSYIHWISKTYQGAGKLFWYRGFRPKLYGQPASANKVETGVHHAKKRFQS